MKELPKKGYIKVTHGNEKELNNFLKNNKHLYKDCTKFIIYTGDYLDYPQTRPGCIGSTFIREEATEISFEDFQRLVLNINVKKVYELW